MTPGAAPRLRPAVAADADFLHALEEACMRVYAEALWGAWTPRPPERFALGDHRILVRGGADLGCLAVEERADHLWVDKLYVAPGAQNGGLGAWMLAVARAEAHESGKPVRLSVLRTNPALRFYLRHGFRVAERTSERSLMTDAPARRARR